MERGATARLGFPGLKEAVRCSCDQSCSNCRQVAWVGGILFVSTLWGIGISPVGMTVTLVFYLKNTFSPPQPEIPPQ